jgi:hypothetical protein
MSHSELFKRLSKLSGVLLFIAAFFIIDGCRKAATYQDISDGLTDPEVLQAKSWYDITYPANTVSRSTGRVSVSGFSGANKYDYSQHVKPWWQHTAKYSRFGKHVLEIPIDPANPVLSALQNRTTSKFIAPKENSSSSFLIMNSTAGYEAYIMTIIADSAYLKGDRSKVSHNTYNKRDTDFSGMVLYFTPKGDYLSGYAYKNGRQVSPSSSSAQSSKGNVVQSQSRLKTNDMIVPADPPGCTTYWLAYYDSNGDLVSYTFLFQLCDPTSGPGNGNPPNSDPPPPLPPRCPPSDVDVVSIPATKLHVNNIPLPPDDDPGFPPPDPSKPDPCHPVTPADTTVKVVDSCLLRALKAITANNPNNKIGDAINATFASNAKFNLIYAQTDTISSLNRMAFTSPMVLTINAQGDSVYTMTIALNEKILTNSSQEFIALTILHEGVHAFFNRYQFLYGNPLGQHMFMSTNYVDYLRTSLQSVYNISNDNANSIILGEFADISTTYPVDFANLMSKYNLTSTQLLSALNGYKNGTLGIKCP